MNALVQPWRFHLLGYPAGLAWPPGLLLAVLALLGSGYLLFRPLASCGVTDDACVDSRRVAQRIYLISGMFVSGLLLFPLVAPIFY